MHPQEDKFTAIVKLIHTDLKAHGFVKRRLNFYYRSGENRGVINLQRSAWNFPDSEISFTVNWGLYLAALEDGELPAPPYPPHQACHVRGLLNYFLKSEDKWWTVTPATEAGSMAQEISTILVNDCIPYMHKHLTPQAIARYVAKKARRGYSHFLP